MNIFTILQNTIHYNISLILKWSFFTKREMAFKKSTENDKNNWFKVDSWKKNLLVNLEKLWCLYKKL